MTELLVFLGLVAAASSSGAADGQANGDVNWDLILKALGFLVAATAAYFQVRNLNFAMRVSLKTDLEILNLLNASDPNYTALKRAVDMRVKSLYPEEETDTSAQRVLRIMAGFIGVFWTLGFAYWTFSLSLPDFSWWSLLTGYLAFVGVGILVMAISGKHLLGKNLASLEATFLKHSTPGTGDA